MCMLAHLACISHTELAQIGEYASSLIFLLACFILAYPVSLIFPRASPIHPPGDLKGHTIDDPGPFGATHIGLIDLFYQAYFTPNDLLIRAIGFTQVSAFLGRHVDAVMGYSNNEPLQLR